MTIFSRVPILQNIAERALQMSFLRKVVAPAREPALREAKNEHKINLVPVGVYPALRWGVVVTRKRIFGIILE